MRWGVVYAVRLGHRILRRELGKIQLRTEEKWKRKE